jgi:hypothetical protein
MDQALLRLAQAADAGKPCPPINLLAGTSLFVGTPVSRDGFAQESEKQIAEALYYSRKPSKRNMESVYEEATGAAAEVIEGLRGAVADSGADTVLTLRDAEIWPASGGDGVEVPIVRIPLVAVDGWWTGVGKRLKAGGGGGFFFGVFAPVPEA